MADEEQQNDELMTAPKKVEDILAEMRAARSAFHAGRMTEADYVDKILNLDRSLTQGLTGRFNSQSGMEIAYPDPQATTSPGQTNTGSSSQPRLSDIEQQFIDRIQARSNAPASFYTAENEISSRRAMLNALIENHPQLRSMTLADAVEIVDKTASGKEIDWKYGEANATVVISAAVAMIDCNRDKIATDYPDMNRMISAKSPTYLRELIGERLMVRVTDDEEFMAWEGEKRDQVIAAIRADKTLMDDIGKIRPLLDSATENEFVEQNRLRQSITERLAGIYAQVYGVPELGQGNVATFYAPAEKLLQNDTYGFAGGVPGIRNEEYVILRSSLYPELLLREPTDTTREVGEKFLSDVNEEMRHAVDGLYADRLVNDQLPEDHPAFRHTNLIFFNHFNYAHSDENYARQYIERTAKEAAAEVTAVIGGGIFPPDPVENRPQGQVIELEGMTIRGNAKP